MDDPLLWSLFTLLYYVSPSMMSLIITKFLFFLSVCMSKNVVKVTKRVSGEHMETNGP